MSEHSIIYLVGFMGSGKTTAAKKLSALLGWNFVDLDSLIEQRTGKRIPEIFSSDGEELFRRIETKILRELIEKVNIVVSTGGGAPCHDANMDFMLDTGVTVYLKLTPAQLRDRLASSKTERPLIKAIDKNNLQDYIEKKLSERENFYNRALITMEGCELDAGLLLQKIKALHEA